MPQGMTVHDFASKFEQERVGDVVCLEAPEFTADRVRRGALVASYRGWPVRQVELRLGCSFMLYLLILRSFVSSCWGRFRLFTIARYP